MHIDSYMPIKKNKNCRKGFSLSLYLNVKLKVCSKCSLFLTAKETFCIHTIKYLSMNHHVTVAVGA